MNLSHCHNSNGGACMQLLRETGLTTLNKSPLWLRPELSQAELLREYHSECSVVRRGINADLNKVDSSPPSLRWYI